MNNLPRMTKINMIFVISFASIFLLSSVLVKTSGVSLYNFLGLSSQAFLSGKIWTPLTYVFLPHGFFNTLMEGLIFWFIGSELESMWGEKRYLTFLTVAGLGGGLIYLIFNMLFFPDLIHPLSGPAGLASTLCVAYGILFPERTMYFIIFPLQAKWFAMILVGMNLYQGFFSPGGILAWSQLITMALGTLWMVFVSNPSLKGVFQGLFHKSSSSGAPGRRKRKKASKISHLHIVEDEGKAEEDDDTPPTYH